MDQVVNHRLAGKRFRAGKENQAGPLVAEIIEALIACNGEAHRDVVIERVAIVRAQGLSAVVETALANQIITAFDAYTEAAPRMTQSKPLLHKPFGPDSHRWALTPEAKALLRNRAPVALS